MNPSQRPSNSSSQSILVLPTPPKSPPLSPLPTPPVSSRTSSSSERTFTSNASTAAIHDAAFRGYSPTPSINTLTFTLPTPPESRLQSLVLPTPPFTPQASTEGMQQEFDLQDWSKTAKKQTDCAESSFNLSKEVKPGQSNDYKTFQLQSGDANEIPLAEYLKELERDIFKTEPELPINLNAIPIEPNLPNAIHEVPSTTTQIATPSATIQSSDRSRTEHDSNYLVPSLSLRVSNQTFTATDSLILDEPPKSKCDKCCDILSDVTWVCKCSNCTIIITQMQNQTSTEPANSTEEVTQSSNEDGARSGLDSVPSYMIPSLSYQIAHQTSTTNLEPTQKSGCDGCCEALSAVAWVCKSAQYCNCTIM